MKDIAPECWRARRADHVIEFNHTELTRWFGDKFNTDLTNILQLGVGYKHIDRNGWKWERIA